MAMTWRAGKHEHQPGRRIDASWSSGAGCRLNTLCASAGVLALLVVLALPSASRAQGYYYYTVTVTQPERHIVHVAGAGFNVAGAVTLQYREEGFDPDGPIPPVQNVRAWQDARPIQVRQSGRDYQIGLLTPATRETPLVFEYDCVLHQIHPRCTARDQYECYLDSTFGIFRASYLLLQPQGDVALAAVRFRLPDGWGATTPWTREGEWYLMRAPRGINVDLGECVIGVGAFEIHQRQIGKTLVTVAMLGDLDLLKTRIRFRSHGGQPTPPRDSLPDFVFKLFEYYLKVVGDCPLPRYTVFFYPLTADGRWVNCSAWATGTAQEYETPPEVIAHEIFHWWNRVVPVHDGIWISEGWTWFFAWKGAVATGFVADEAWKQRVRGFYTSYLAEASQPKLRIPVTTPDDRLTAMQLNSLIARREVLAYVLNERLKAESSGARTLADVVAALYRLFGPPPGEWRGRPYGYSDVDAAVRSVGGAQAADFLQRHIAGTEIAFAPDLCNVWLEPHTVQEGVRTPVRLFVRPAEYLLRDRERAALVVRLSEHSLSRSQLAELILPNLRADVALGSEEIAKRYGQETGQYDYDAEIVFTVQVRKSGEIWMADLNVLAVKGASYFIWDSTGHDFSGVLHPIACYL